MREFDDVVLDITGKFPKIILEKDKVEIIKQYNLTTHPGTVGAVEIQVTNEPPALESNDWKLLELLSADTVRYKMKQYQEISIISNYAVLLNLSLLGYEWYTFSIELKTFNRKDEQKFQAFLGMNPCIIRATKTLGGWDLLLYIVVRTLKSTTL